MSEYMFNIKGFEVLIITVPSSLEQEVQAFGQRLDWRSRG
jgi:hypothetical protein